jgi:superfamily II RNA helicase
VSPEAVKAELKKTFSEKDAAMLALSFKTVQELERMCDQEAKIEEYLDKLLVLKNYTEGFSEKFTKHLEEFSRFMKQEQLEYLDDVYKGKVRRFCTNLVDVWIAEFLKG